MSYEIWDGFSYSYTVIAWPLLLGIIGSVKSLPRIVCRRSFSSGAPAKVD